VGLLGPNGAGKTTTIRILSTLLPFEGGHATVGGFDIVQQPQLVRGVIGLTGQYAAVDDDLTGREALALAAHQADVLVHDATFADEEGDRARQTLHSTARQAAELARDAEVRLLALTHVSSRYAGGELRDQARAVFAATELPRDFDTIEVPFPERGGATLVRWSERQAREREQQAPAPAPPEPVASP